MESVAVGQEAARQAPAAAAPRQPWYQVVANGPAARQAPSQARPLDAAAAAQEAADVAARPGVSADAMRAAHAGRRAALPFAPPHAKEQPPTADGRRNCGPLEPILHRQWHEEARALPAAVITAIDRLAELPRLYLQQKLADGLDRGSS